MLSPAHKTPFALAMLCALMLGGCATTTATGGTSVCAVWRPISWSVKDSDATIAEVKVNNARQRGWCGA